MKGVCEKKAKARRVNTLEGTSCNPTSESTGGRLMREALQLARDPKALEKARGSLCKDFTSNSSRRAKETKRVEVLRLASTVAEAGRPLPLSVDVVEKVSAAMKAAGFKSGQQYLAELRLAHIEAGFELGPGLVRSFTQCKRALERGSGPVRRAPEVRATQLIAHRPKTGRNASKLLMLPDLSYLWAMTWMLREIELREIRWEHLTVKEGDRLVTLRIHKSKTDQAGLGVRRTLTCCGREVCDPVCAWNLARELKKHERNKDDLMFVTREGKIPSKQDVINSWKWTAGRPCTGHSARRSGAMHYVRAGMNISELAYLGRWKSSVVLTYAEEALEEVAANRGQAQLPVRHTSLVTTKETSDNPQPAEQRELDQSHPSEDAKPGRAEEEPWTYLVTPPKALWVMTKGKGTMARPVHLVTLASWSLPLARWSTACGWNFAERSTEFHFVPSPSLSHQKCRKCLSLKYGRDKIKEVQGAPATDA